MQKGRRNENILERSRQWMEIKSINIYSAETSIKHFQCNLNNKFSLKTSRFSFSFYMQEWKEHRGERLHIGQWEEEEKSLRSSEIYKHICGMQSYVGAASVCYHTHWAAEPKRLEKCFTAFSHVVRCDLFARALSCILNGKLRNVCRSWRCSSSCCSWHIAEGESRINKEKSPSSFAAHKNFTSRRMFGSVTKWNNNRFLSSSALARCRQTSDFNFRKCRVHFKSLSLWKWSSCGRPWACTFRSLLLWLLCDDNRLNWMASS